MSMPASLRELLTKLSFLGMLKEGKKPCMNDLSFVDANSFYGSIVRMLSGENRNSGMMSINQIIDQTITAINEYRETEFIDLIVKTLYESKQGISTMEVTYKNRPGIVSSVKMCVQNIDIQLNANEQFLPLAYRNKGRGDNKNIDNKIGSDLRGDIRNDLRDNKSGERGDIRNDSRDNSSTKPQISTDNLPSKSISGTPIGVNTSNVELGTSTKS